MVIHPLTIPIAPTKRPWSGIFVSMFLASQSSRWQSRFSTFSMKNQPHVRRKTKFLLSASCWRQCMSCKIGSLLKWHQTRFLRYVILNLLLKKGFLVSFESWNHCSSFTGSPICGVVRWEPGLLNAPPTTREILRSLCLCFPASHPRSDPQKQRTTSNP